MEPHPSAIKLRLYPPEQLMARRMAEDPARKWKVGDFDGSISRQGSRMRELVKAGLLAPREAVTLPAGRVFTYQLSAYGLMVVRCWSQP